MQAEMIQSKSSFIQVITTLKQDDEEEVRLNLGHNGREQRRTYKHYQPQISNQLQLHLILPYSTVDSMNLRSQTYTAICAKGVHTLTHTHKHGCSHRWQQSTFHEVRATVCLMLSCPALIQMVIILPQGSLKLTRGRPFTVPTQNSYFIMITYAYTVLSL